jgi:riboflavin synthase
MFTGIVEETGVIESLRKTKSGIQLTVRCRACARGVKKGDSIAVNGCCLTVTKIQRRGQGTLLHFDLLHETWTCTNLQFSKAGSLVNLERSLAADGRIGGHFVTGHVDGVGTIHRWVFKGSIAVDGISLTVAKVGQTDFRIWIIPHTFDHTALRERKVGDVVNLEADMLGKYVERFVSAHRG